jgi:tRNA(Ile)-lysidine synthase
MKGTKKLQDIFVDAKIPRHIRGHWPVVVTASNEIVWVPNLVKNRKFFENTADNYQYLTCEVV